MPAYADLRAQQAALGLRHAADGLFPPTAGQPARAVRFLVLDGLRIPGRGGRPRHVDRRCIAELRAAQAGPEATAAAAWTALLARYDAILAEDPMGLRRVVLYELSRLLGEDPQGPRPETAVALGVDPLEAKALAYAAGRTPRLDADGREAAETLPDIWRAHRVRRAHALAGRLPTPLRDQRLARLVARIESRAGHADRLLREARALKRAGEGEAAVGLYLRAARAAEDDAHALRGLVLARRPGGLRVEPGHEGVRLEWRMDAVSPVSDDASLVSPASPASPSAKAWRILRHAPGHAPVAVGEIAATPPPGAGATAAVVFTDATAALGTRVRYAVLPLAGGRIAGLPLVSPDVLVAPEADEVRLSDARARIEAEWRTPPEARRVVVVRSGPSPDATAAEIPAALHGFRDEGLSPGTYEYAIRCVYRTADGREIRSPGLRVRRTVHPWPTAVTALTVGPGSTPGTLEATWTGGDEGTVSLREWPGTPPPAGRDLLPGADPLPPPLPWPRTGPTAFRPPPGTAAYLTAVTVLGERAVTGPSVRVDVPEAVRALTVRRAGAGRARLTFEWPGEADRVLVRWWQGGEAGERVVARSTYFREGLHLDVTAAALRVQVEPVPAGGADVLLPPSPAAAELPADVAVAYTVGRSARIPGRRRRVTVRAEALGAAGPAALPDLLIVARAEAEPLPRTPEDGTPVGRLSGAELRDGPVFQDVATAVAEAGIRRPYTVRAFLLGPHAHAVRLEDPPYKDLVVR
ncbi:hypothetical protein ACSNOK_02460 [Streptomyces sp. URMC 126]|uniref:hypothetical protein n=1 Tax=Streptomyces sp. URMC 126 TaxID=3423401 RepID=UPI003F1DB6DB